MEIFELKKITEEVLDAFQNLIPQLDTSCKIPTREDLKTIISNENTFVFMAKNDTIFGALTLVIYNIPTGKKAWIEDVVVDKNIRGQGIGAKLIEYAINFSKNIGIEKLDLTSRPSRVAANELYKKLGFELRETNVYRKSLS